MPPLFDTHCHLHAGLDDGPATVAEAVEMCRAAWLDGVRTMVAVAHQNASWPEATAERIAASTLELGRELDKQGIEVQLVPGGEVMIGPELLDDWRAGRLVGVGGGDRYLLIEMPLSVFLDIGNLVSEMVAEGVRPILAHPERYRELWHSPELMVDWIRRGCLMQACADGILNPDRQVQRQLRYWFTQGWIHLIASDGHSLATRPPGLAEAFIQVARWTNRAVAERLCHAHPQTIVEDQRLIVPEPRPAKARWFARGR